MTRTTGGRDAVLRSAVELMTAVGYHATSMRDISRRADVTVASIYYHFPSKQEILQEIMVGVLTDVIRASRSTVLALGGDPREQLAELVRTWVLFHIERQDEALIGASELRSLDEAGRAEIVALRDEQENIFRGLIDRGVEVGAFSTPYPREAARAIINMGRSVVAWYRPDGSASPDTMAQTYASLALALAGAAVGHTENSAPKLVEPV